MTLPAHRPSSALRRCAACTALLASALAHADASAQQAPSPSLQVAPAQVKLGLERVTLPGDETMGLVGTTYLVGLGHGFSFGPAAYGAISGRRGGFFTVGAELSWQYALVGPLRFDTGMYLGGGGGGAAPVGGGLMLRPHADLLWDFGPVMAGISASQVRFPNGSINSHQVGLVLTANTDFAYVPGDRIGEPAESRDRAGMGFERLQAVFGAYRPSHGSRRVSGPELTSTIGWVGMRAEHTFEPTSTRVHYFWGVEAAGAASGGVAGYAEYLATLGVETAVWGDALVLGARTALGMGGGGDIDTGGGLLVKAGAYGALRITRDFGFVLEGGAVSAPRGSLRAPYASASFIWMLEDIANPPSPRANARTEWIGGAEHYVARRTDGSQRGLQAVTLKGNRFITEYLYVSGQAHSAYAGGAGGYTSGLVGFGLQSSLWGPLRGGVEMLVGAAGGGGVSTQGGAIAQPSAYLGVDITPSWSLRVGAGRVKSLRGDPAAGLDATVVDAALAFVFGVPTRAPW